MCNFFTSGLWTWCRVVPTRVYISPAGDSAGRPLTCRPPHSVKLMEPRMEIKLNDATNNSNRLLNASRRGCFFCSAVAVNYRPETQRPIRTWRTFRVDEVVRLKSGKEIPVRLPWSPHVCFWEVWTTGNWVFKFLKKCKSCFIWPEKWFQSADFYFYFSCFLRARGFRCARLSHCQRCRRNPSYFIKKQLVNFHFTFLFLI